jgi:hypothetical protein
MKPTRALAAVRLSQPARSLGATFARCGVVAALGVGSVWAIRLASSQQALPTTTASARAWLTTTDLERAVLPVLVFALALGGVVLLGAAALYGALRALGCARAAAAFGWVVLPALRRRVDRAVAIGMLASITTVGVGGLASAAHALDVGDATVVRDPAPTTALDDAPAASPAPATLADAVRDPDAPADAATRDDAISTVTRAPDAASSNATLDPAPQSDPALMGPRAEPQDAPDDAPVVALDPTINGFASSSGAVRTGSDDADTTRTGEVLGAPAPAPVSSAPPSATPSTRPSTVAQQYVVVPGDDLWSIATRQLARHRGVDGASLDAHDVAPYWVAVVEANRATLRSGNPNLIYSGETLALPAFA